MISLRAGSGWAGERAADRGPDGIGGQLLDPAVRIRHPVGAGGAVMVRGAGRTQGPPPPLAVGGIRVVRRRVDHDAGGAPVRPHRPRQLGAGGRVAAPVVADAHRHAAPRGRAWRAPNRRRWSRHGAAGRRRAITPSLAPSRQAPAPKPERVTLAPGVWTARWPRRPWRHPPRGRVGGRALAAASCRDQSACASTATRRERAAGAAALHSSGSGSRSARGAAPMRRPRRPAPPPAAVSRPVLRRGRLAVPEPARSRAAGASAVPGQAAGGATGPVAGSRRQAGRQHRGRPGGAGPPDRRRVQGDHAARFRVPGWGRARRAARARPPRRPRRPGGHGAAPHPLDRGHTAPYQRGTPWGRAVVGGQQHQRRARAGLGGAGLGGAGLVEPLRPHPPGRGVPVDPHRGSHPSPQQPGAR